MHTFSETGPGVPAFLAKLWRLVEDPATDNLIYWSPDGKSFIIQNQAQFARELLPLNYKHNNMASFIRQLNMYGFHKITSIDNGGLKFDRDDMEFSHPYFQRGVPYLVDNIKRKIAHPKSEEKGSLKPETVHKVLTEVSAKVKNMRGRQDTLDNRFLAMKQENEALWREIAVLRQKHMKQQQIVNKLIQFLVTIVQPQRTGLGGMGGKRRFQLMINDTPQSSKMPRNEGTDTGPIIHELGEELLDEVCDSETDLINLSEMGENNVADSRLNDENRSNNHYGSMGDSEYIMADSSDCDDLVINETESISSDNQDQNNVNYVNEYDDDYNVLDETEQILATPLARREMDKHQKQLQLQQQKIQKQQQVIRDQQRKLTQSYRPKATANKSLLKNNKQANTNKRMFHNNVNINNNNKVNNKVLIKVEQNTGTGGKNSTASYSPNNNNMDQSDVPLPDNNTGNIIDGVNIKMEKLPMYSNQEDFMNAEMPNDIFDDENTSPGNPDSSPMIGGITLDGSAYHQNVAQMVQNKQNPNIRDTTCNNSGNNDNPNNSTESKLQEQQNKSNWALTEHNKSDDLLKLNTPAEYDQHLESFQGELDSLKDLLRGDGGVSVDANALLGDQYIGGSTNQNRSPKFMSPTNLDLEQYLKLFADSDLLAPYGISLSEKNNDENFPNYGSEMMTYQPSINCDLSELLDEESLAGDPPVTNAPPSSKIPENRTLGLQTPVYEKDFQSFKK